MKSKVILKRIVDAAMYILFLILMGQCVLRGAVHEWLGIAVGVLFILHNALNYRWYTALLRGKYTPARIVQTTVNFLLVIAVILCTISGILISQHIFAVGNGGTIEFGRHLHLVVTAWAFVLMTFHLGLHWSIFKALGEKFFADKKLKRSVGIICRVLVFALCLYGLYQFVDRRFWEELFHLIDYQKEYDYSKSLPTYFIGTAALAVPFIAAAHYLKRLLSRDKKRANTAKKPTAR